MTDSDFALYTSYVVSFPGNAWQLNQDPSSGFGVGMMSKGFFLQTLIHNVGLIFCDSLPGSPGGHMSAGSPRKRLSATELLVAQAFPVHPVLCQDMLQVRPPITSFSVRRASRKVRTVAAQAGNTMHAGCIFVNLLYDYQEVRLANEMLVLRCLGVQSRLASAIEAPARGDHDGEHPEKRRR